MKKYREAKTDKEKKRGKSTDELSFKEALNFFKKRGKDKGASKFRWRGDVYNLDGDKVGGSKKTSASTNTAPKTSKRPQTPSTGNRSSSGGPARYDSTKTRMSSGPSTRRGPATDKNKTRRTGGASSSGLSITAKVYPITSEVTNPEDSVKSGSLTVTPAPKKSRFPGIERIVSAFEKLPKGIDYSNNEEALKLWDAFKKEWQNLGPDARRDLARVRRMFGWGFEKENSNKSGMAKGGMVRKGNANYKGKGMFYKSASPRGYK